MVMVILAEAEQWNFERVYIRNVSPIFNVIGVGGDDAIPRAVTRLLGSAASQDARMVASLLLHKNRPRLPVQA